MEQRTDDGLSPYRVFSRAEWAAKRADTPMTLKSDEVTRLRSLHDRLDMTEVEEIYLPLSRLLSLYVAATQRLFLAQQNFLGTEDAKVPFIIGVGGSVAVGKSTTARVLQALLARWPNVPKVDLITTDGFLYPNAILEREDLMEKKGFPESYDLPALLRFLSDIKAGGRLCTRRSIPISLMTSCPINGSRSTGPISSSSKASTCCRPGSRRRAASRAPTYRTSSTFRSTSTPTRT